jgi:hypothetical protein
MSCTSSSRGCDHPTCRFTQLALIVTVPLCAFVVFVSLLMFWFTNRHSQSDKEEIFKVLVRLHNSTPKRSSAEAASPPSSGFRGKLAAARSSQGSTDKASIGGPKSQGSNLV